MASRFIYYLDLARRSFARDRALTSLMVVAIALGIGTSMTTLTVLYVLSGDPLPAKSDRLFYVQLDAAGQEEYRPGEEPQLQLTRFDGEALLRARRAQRQAMMTGGAGAVESERPGVAPFHVDTRYTSADFFAMFDVPFARGAAWSASDDEARSRIAVVSKKLADKLFEGGDAVGRMVRVDQHDLAIVGVLDEWRPTPHFYDLFTGTYDDAEQLYLPFSTSRELELERRGSVDCWGEGHRNPTAYGASCAWIQFWVQLEGREQAAAYRDFLVSYSEEQRRAGRFARPPNPRLRSLMEWLEFQRVVPNDVRLQAWVAFAFLAVCLLNTVGLLLAKFLRRSGEIGVRRALGASRRAIFGQFLVEAGSIGLLGGIFGLALAWLGLWAVRQQPVDYAPLVQLDAAMLGANFALAMAASLLSGLLPAWRAGQVAPALQLKSQ